MDTRSAHDSIRRVCATESTEHVARILSKYPRNTKIVYSSMYGHVEILDRLKLSASEASRASYLAARYGNPHVLTYLHAEYEARPDSRGVDDAMRNGHLETVRWCVDHGVANTMKGSTGAMRNGHLEVLEHAMSQGTLSARYVDAACNQGHAPVIEWGLSHGLAVSAGAIEGMVGRGQTDLLAPIVARDDHKQAVFEAALVHGNLGLATSLSRGRRVSPGTLDRAAGNGHLDVLRWAKTTCGETPTKNAMRLAAENGRSSVVDWLWTVNRRVPESVAAVPEDGIRRRRV